MLEQIENASPTSSFDFNDFTAEAMNPNYQFMETGGYANPFLMPSVPMDLDAFTQSFWVGFEYQTLCRRFGLTRLQGGFPPDLQPPQDPPPPF